MTEWTVGQKVKIKSTGKTGTLLDVFAATGVPDFIGDAILAVSTARVYITEPRAEIVLVYLNDLEVPD